MCEPKCVCFDSTPISSHVIAAPELADCVYSLKLTHESFTSPCATRTSEHPSQVRETKRHRMLINKVLRSLKKGEAVEPELFVIKELIWLEFLQL